MESIIGLDHYSTFTEKTPVRVAEYLTSVTLAKFKTLFSPDDKDVEVYYNRVVAWATSICAQGAKQDSHVEQTYNYSTGGGRIYSSGNGLTIQGLSVPVRGIVCRDHMVDIDMVNAHPTLLLYLLNSKKINMKPEEYEALATR